ncbi:hypothetical protein GIB67_016933 [Kingdonia uniflora]|uniref:Uncharacterized protein n=1 Tax=Kingdonia uniflora TaxID=39325 RepID=A0A7J7M3D8_9MAGN|nr:hypothetical protein GIB67_016933 [Kingdonia uniflora]
MLIQNVHLKPFYHRGSNRLHLYMCHFFPQTHSWSSVKNWESKWIFRPENSILQPPTRYILPTVFPPNTLHSPHCIQVQRYKTSFANNSAIGKNVVV